MAKLTKREIMLLKKLQKANLYPGLQRKLEDNLRRYGAEGVNVDKNLEKILNQRSVENRNMAQGRSQQLDSGMREESPAGFGMAEVGAAVAPPLINAGIKGVGNLLRRGYNYFKGRPDAIAKVEDQRIENILDGMPEEEANALAKQAIKEIDEGAPEKYELIPSEMPEDTAYRQQLRKDTLPYLMRGLERSERTPRTALGDIDKVIQQYISGVNSVGRGAGRLGRNLNSLIGAGIENVPSINRNDINSLIGSSLRGGQNRLGQGYNYLRDQGGSLTDILNQGLHNARGATGDYANSAFDYLNSLRRR